MIISLGHISDPWSLALIKNIQTRELATWKTWLTLGLFLLYRRLKDNKTIILNNNSNQIFFTIPAKIMAYKVIWLTEARKPNVLTSLLIKFNAFFVNRVIAPNQQQENIYLKLKIPDKKIKLIYPFCDQKSRRDALNASLSALNPSPQGARGASLQKRVIKSHEKAKKAIILSCDGNIEIENGLGILLKAIALAQEILGDIKLIIGGQILEKQKLIWLAANLNVGLKFVPSLNHTWAQEADIYLLPTTSNGQVPLSLLYAAYFGKPVIASKLANNKEFVIEKLNGILVEPQNPEMLSQAIINLCRRPGWIMELGANNKKFALEKFSQEVFEENISQILNDDPNGPS